MRRRVFLVAGGASALLATPLGLNAQTLGKVYRIGLLGAYTDNPTFQRVFGEFRRGMAELGWIEGKNYARIDRWAKGELARLPALADELVSLGPDALMVGTPETAIALKNATRTIPIVAIAIPDPVEIGLAKSLAAPGENVTGPTFAFSELTAKQIELLKEAMPRISRVGVLVHSESRTRERQVDYAQAAAARFGVQVKSVGVSAPEDFEPALKSIRDSGADAVLIAGTPFTLVHRERLAELALRHRLPTMWNNPAAIEAGGLISYGVNIDALWHRAAVFMDKILRGAKAGDLPFERPVKFELVINMKLAKALDLSIPQSILLRADRVIE